MLAVILAGGYATRLWPLTKSQPKPLLPIAGRPILEYVTEKLDDIPVRRTVISTNRRFERYFKNWLETHDHKTVELFVDNSHSEEDKPGAVKALVSITSSFKDDWMVIAGDNFFTSSLKGILQRFREKNSPLVALYDVKDLSLARRYATVSMNPVSRITELVEKPPNPKTTLIATCIYILPKRILPRIAEYVDKGVGNDEPGRFVGWLCKHEAVYGYMLRGYWCDIGSVETYREVDSFVRGQSST